MLSCRYLLMSLVAILALSPVYGQGEKKKPKTKRKLPVGTWVREAGDFRIQMTIRPKSLVVALSKEGQTLKVYADIGFARSNHFFGRIAKVSLPVGGDGPKVGHLFSFHYELRDGKLVLSEMRGEGSDEAAEVVEGEYTRVKGKKKNR